MGEINKALGAAGGGHGVPALGKTYTLSDVTKRIMAEFESFHESHALAGVRKRRDVLDQEEYTELLARVSEGIDIGEYSWGGTRWRRFVRQESGMVRLTWLLLRKHHPGITEEETLKAIKDSPLEFGARLRMLLSADPNTEPSETAGAAG